MKILTAALAALILAAPAAAQQAKAGYVHCTNVESLKVQDRIVRRQGIRAWSDWIAGSRDVCHVSSGDAEVRMLPARPDGGVLIWEEREIVCVRSDDWDGCHYAFKEAVWTPPN